jgi:hypothetical protein
MHPPIGGRVEPTQCLRIEIVQVLKMQARPKIAAHIFHAVLDFALGPSRQLHRLRP